MRMGLTPYLKNSIVIDSIRTLRKTKGGRESPNLEGDAALAAAWTREWTP